MRHIFISIGIVALSAVSVPLYAASQSVQKEQSSELIAIYELSEVAINPKFEIRKAAFFTVSNSHLLIRHFYIDALQWEAEQIARKLCVWAVPFNFDVTMQLFKKQEGALAPFEFEKVSEFSSPVQLSRETGKSVAADLINCPQAGTSVVTVVHSNAVSIGDEFVRLEQRPRH